MKQEVRRGRKFVEYHDPDTQDEFTFTQEISGADVSYQDEAGNWHPADENWATDGVDGFILKNDKLNHKVRLKGTGGRTWYPRRNVNTEYMTFGVPQYWNGKRWANFGFSGWSVEGKTITLQTNRGVTILVHNRWNGIKIDWVLASSTAPSRMRYPVSLTGITYVDGIIYGADGTRLGQLTPTTATDANGLELACTGAYSGGYVEFQADVTGAVYPVVVDPDFSIGNTNYGDTVLCGGHTTRRSYNYGAFGLSQVYTATKDRVLMRFDLTSIANTNTCTAATLKLYHEKASADTRIGIYTAYSIAAANSDWIEGTQSDQLAASGSPCWNARKADGSGGVTSAWAGSEGLSTSGTDYEATSLGSVQCAGNAPVHTEMFIDLTPTRVGGWFGETNTNYGLLIIQSAHANNQAFGLSELGDSAYRPVLSVTYSGGGALRRTNMNAQMQNLSGGIHG